MTERLAQAFAEASKLPEEEQNWLAEWILAELADERRWTESFAASGDLLERWAKEALTEDREGRTLPYDPATR